MFLPPSSSSSLQDPWILGTPVLQGTVGGSHEATALMPRGRPLRCPGTWERSKSLFFRTPCPRGRLTALVVWRSMSPPTTHLPDHWVGHTAPHPGHGSLPVLEEGSQPAPTFGCSGLSRTPTDPYITGVCVCERERVGT